MNLEHRTALPLAASSGCSCCPPAGSAPKAPAAVVIAHAAAETPDADTPAPTLSHLSQ
jgi:hypothetical protein